MSEFLYFDDGPKVDEAEAAKILTKDTQQDVSKREVEETWHYARDVAEESGDLQRGSAPGSGGQGGKKDGQ